MAKLSNVERATLNEKRERRAGAHGTSVRQDLSRSLPGIVLGIAESIVAGFSLGVGIALEALYLRHFDQVALMAGSKLMFVSIGAAFSYAFVFVLRKRHLEKPTGLNRNLIKQILTNITCAYLLEFALIFLTTGSNLDFGRAAVMTGFATACLLLAIFRFLFKLPLAVNHGIEGKRILIIKSNDPGPKVSAAEAKIKPESHRLEPPPDKVRRKRPPVASGVASN
jgi:hypothetical protein